MKQFLIISIALIALQGALGEVENDIVLGEAVAFKCTNYLYTRHADPERCDRYYTCSNKVAYHKQCSGNLYFQSSTRTCVNRSFVQCGRRVDPAKVTTTVIPTIPSTTSTTSTTTPKPTTTKPVGFKCTNYLYTRHVDPERCDRFYTCYMKKAYLNECPGNLYFQSFTRTCAVHSIANCGSRADRPKKTTTVIPTTPSTPATTSSTTPKPTTPKPTTPKPTTPSTTATTSTTTPKSTTPKPTTPKPTTPKPTTPSTTDKTSTTTPTPTTPKPTTPKPTTPKPTTPTTPATSPTTTPKPTSPTTPATTPTTTPKPTSPTTPATTPTTTPEPITPSTTHGPSPTQPPPDCSTLEGYYPNLDDCHRFYSCSNGKLIGFTCPDNLVFNTDINTCDYLENVPRCNGA